MESLELAIRTNFEFLPNGAETAIARMYHSSINAHSKTKWPGYNAIKGYCLRLFLTERQACMVARGRHSDWAIRTHQMEQQLKGASDARLGKVHRMTRHERRNRRLEVVD